MLRKSIVLLFIMLSLFVLASCEEKHQHVWTEEVEIQPTCENEGTKKFTCVCGEVRKETIPATGHGEIKEEQIVPPGCLTKGQNNQSCSVCGKILSVVEVPALGHDMAIESVKVEPTCTTAGEGVGSCQRCGEQLDAWEIPALGHDWGPSIVDKYPTCTETGAVHVVCKRNDKHVMGGIINKKPHDFSGESSITIPATCTAEGEKEVKCANCDTTTVVSIPKADHRWTAWVNTSVAGEFQDGERYRSCEDCGLVEEETVKATHVHKTLEDAPVAWDETNVFGNNIEGTCTKKAVVYAYCTCYVDDEGNVYEDVGKNRHKLPIGSKELDFDENNHLTTTKVLKSESGYFCGPVYAVKCTDCGADLGTQIEEGNAKELDGRWVVQDRMIEEPQSMDVEYDMSFFKNNIGKVSMTMTLNNIVDGVDVPVATEDIMEDSEYAAVSRRCVDGDWLVDWKTNVTEFGKKQIVLAENYVIEVESEDVANKTLGINWGMNVVNTPQQEYVDSYTVAIAADNLTSEDSFSMEADGIYNVRATANTLVTLTWVQLEGSAPSSYRWLLDGAETGNTGDTLIVSDISTTHTIQCMTNCGEIKMTLGTL